MKTPNNSASRIERLCKQYARAVLGADGRVIGVTSQARGVISMAYFRPGAENASESRISLLDVLAWQAAQRKTRLLYAIFAVCLTATVFLCKCGSMWWVAPFVCGVIALLAAL